MAKQWWRTVQTWTGELSRHRKVDKGYCGLSGEVKVRGIVNLVRGEPGPNGESRWIGSWEGVGSARISTDRGGGRGELSEKAGMALIIGDKGYRIEFGDEFCSDRYREVEYSGELEGGYWSEGGMNIAYGFAFAPDAAWIHPEMYLPVNPYGHDWISEVVRIDWLPDLSQDDEDDRHLQRWLLIPDDKDAPWSRRRLGGTEPQPRDPPGTPPTMDELAQGIRPGGAPTPPAPVVVPPPPGPPPEVELGTAPEVTVMTGFLVGQGERPTAHFAPHCPALQQAAEFEEVTLNTPSTPRGAARELGAQLCGHCSRILAAKTSPVLFATDGGLRVYEDRVEYEGEGVNGRIVMHMAEVFFSRTGGFINAYGLRIGNGVATIQQDFENREDRDEAADLLAATGAVEE